MATSSMIGRAGRRRRGAGWLAAVLMVTGAGIGIGLVIRGSSSTPPPPAPTPDHPFSVAAPPDALLPGDVIPPVTGSAAASLSDPVTDSDTQAPAGSTAGPPKHVGPWTYQGPQRIFIQSLDVEAPIDTVGSDNGAVIVPTDVLRVGRWAGGAGLGDAQGTVLIVGHVNYASQGAGVLFNLFQIQPGAVIVTNDRDGIRASWRVVGLESVDKQALPTDIFTRDGPRRLVLVTCGGDLLHVDGPDGGYNTYQNNVVVRAVPA